MTDVDDLYEPADCEPEPCDWYPAPEPVDLEEVEKRLERLKFLASPFGMVATRAELNGTEDLHDLAALIGQEVHGLIAELRQARERIAEGEALPTREEWAVTALGEPAPDPASGAWGGTAELAADYATKHRGQMWRRTVRMDSPEAITPDAPF